MSLPGTSKQRLGAHYAFSQAEAWRRRTKIQNDRPIDRLFPSMERTVEALSDHGDATYRAREDEIDILVTYTRREDDMIMVNSLARPVASVLRHFGWAAMIRSEGWLVPHARLPLVLTALRGAGVTCVDTCAAFTDTETLMPPPANQARYAPQAECAECGTPYPAAYCVEDGDPCWRCGVPLRLIRPLIVGEGEPLAVQATKGDL